MKLTELILELHTLMLEKGNLDVWLNQGCGCCEYAAQPAPRLNDEYDEAYHPGVYLN